MEIFQALNKAMLSKQLTTHIVTGTLALKKNCQSPAYFMKNIFSNDVSPSAAASLWQVPKVRQVDQGAGKGEEWAGGQQGHENANSTEDEGNTVVQKSPGFYTLVRRLPFTPIVVGDS